MNLKIVSVRSKKQTAFLIESVVLFNSLYNIINFIFKFIILHINIYHLYISLYILKIHRRKKGEKFFVSFEFLNKKYLEVLKVNPALSVSGSGDSE